MEILGPDHSSHWYDLATAEPRHRVSYADKKREHETRSATLKDARANGWCPSVTSILKIIDKEALTIWRVEQAIMAALTLPRVEAETEDGFAKRVVEDMKAQTREAARKGTLIHNAGERYLRGRTVYLEPDVEKLFVPLRDWIDSEVLEVIMAEEVLVHREEQYAGTTDLIAILKSYGPRVVDIKTQGTKTKTVYYGEWSLQLEAYRQAYLHAYPKATPIGLLSLVVTSDEPREVQVHEWPEEDTQDRILAFRAAQDLWRWSRGYPRSGIDKPIMIG